MKYLHTPYSVSFRMTLSDLEWLSKIFNDTKRRAVYLRQLNFLYKIRHGGGSQVRSLTPNFTVVALKMWAYRRQNRQKLVIFGINFPQRGILLKRFLQNLAWGRDSQARTLMANLTTVTFKMWAYSPPNRQNSNFWYKFAQKGFTP